MKRKDELLDALISLSTELSAARPGIGISKEHVAQHVGNLVAELEVFTDANYTEKEQEILFQQSAIRLKELKPHGSEG